MSPGVYVFDQFNTPASLVGWYMPIVSHISNIGNTYTGNLTAVILSTQGLVTTDYSGAGTYLETNFVQAFDPATTILQFSFTCVYQPSVAQSLTFINSSTSTTVLIITLFDVAKIRYSSPLLGYSADFSKGSNGLTSNDTILFTGCIFPDGSIQCEMSNLSTGVNMARTYLFKYITVWATNGVDSVKLTTKNSRDFQVYAVPSVSPFVQASPVPSVSPVVYDTFESASITNILNHTSNIGGLYSAIVSVSPLPPSDALTVYPGGTLALNAATIVENTVSTPLSFSRQTNGLLQKYVWTEGSGTFDVLTDPSLLLYWFQIASHGVAVYPLTSGGSASFSLDEGLVVNHVYSIVIISDPVTAITGFPARQTMVLQDLTLGVTIASFDGITASNGTFDDMTLLGLAANSTDISHQIHEIRFIKY